MYSRPPVSEYLLTGGPNSADPHPRRRIFCARPRWRTVPRWPALGVWHVRSSRPISHAVVAEASALRCPDTRGHSQTSGEAHTGPQRGRLPGNSGRMSHHARCEKPAAEEPSYNIRDSPGRLCFLSAGSPELSTMTVDLSEPRPSPSAEVMHHLAERYGLSPSGEPRDLGGSYSLNLLFDTSHDGTPPRVVAEEGR
jgi:hypothetical protein